MNSFIHTKGTSIVEAIVLLIVLIPLCIAIPRLAKIGDFKMQTPQAARYAGWQQAITLLDYGLNQRKLDLELKERIFKSSDLIITSNTQNSGSAHHRNFWYDHFGKASKTLFDTKKDQSLTHTLERFKAGTAADVNLDIANTVVDIIDFGAGDSFAIDEQPIVQHILTFNINNFGLTKACNNHEHLCLSAQHAIFSDGLATDNREMIANQVNSLKPFSMFNGIANGIATVARNSSIFEEGRHMKNMPNHVNIDVLPSDRRAR